VDVWAFPVTGQNPPLTNNLIIGMTIANDEANSGKPLHSAIKEEKQSRCLLHLTPTMA
jgi:hypothetical protein